MSRSRSKPPSKPPRSPPSVRQAAEGRHKKREPGSDTITVYLDACRELIEALEDYGVDNLPDDDDGRKMLGEARDLVTFLQTWKAKPPANAEKRAVVDRVIRLHTAGAIYLEKRKKDVDG